MNMEKSSLVSLLLAVALGLFVPQGPVRAQPAEAQNYDFEAGDRTIFAEDFASDNLGDFPRSLEFLEGNVAVVEWNGRRWLQVRESSKFAVELGEELPEKFTIEFDLHIPDTGSGGVDIFTTDDSRHDPAYYEHNWLEIGALRSTGIVKSGSPSAAEGLASSSSSDVDAVHEGVATARIMVDGSYAKVYVNKRRVANIPNAELPRTGKLWFKVDGEEEEPTLLTDLRIAGGGKDLYDALSTEGRVAVQDILFDTNSAEIKPSSSAVLEEIAGILKDQPEMRLLIEGHTDSQGEFQHNVELSDDRAAAVKAHLVEQHGISPDRLETIGLGPTRPAVSNDTEEGRAENRRVELVRIDWGG